jgi:hypothetical protein
MAGGAPGCFAINSLKYKNQTLLKIITYQIKKNFLILNL